MTYTFKADVLLHQNWVIDVLKDYATARDFYLKGSPKYI